MGLERGAVYVVFGAASGLPARLDLATLDGTNGFAMNGNFVGGYGGYSVSSAGDINGDGFDDVLIGAPRGSAGRAQEGESYLVYGAASGIRLA